MPASREEIAVRVKRAVVALALVAGGTVALGFVAGPAAYEWLKVLHIVAIISWMAGMLYLPRLFVYHCGVAVGSEASETFKVMERRLLRYITNPAMIVSWIVGLWIAWRVYEFHGGWIHAKIALAVVLSGAHGWFAKGVADFARDERYHTARHWRIMNEVPTLLMIVIVILVILKPF